MGQLRTVRRSADISGEFVFKRDRKKNKRSTDKDGGPKANGRPCLTLLVRTLVGQTSSLHVQNDMLAGAVAVEIEMMLFFPRESFLLLCQSKIVPLDTTLCAVGHGCPVRMGGRLLRGTSRLTLASRRVDVHELQPTTVQARCAVGVERTSCCCTTRRHRFEVLSRRQRER